MNLPNDLGHILLWSGSLYFSTKNLYTLALARGISQANLPFTLVTPGGEMEEEFIKRDLPMEKAEFLNRSLLDFFQLSFLVKKFQAPPLSLLHLTHYSQLRRASRFAKKLDIPLILTVYGIDEVDFRTTPVPAAVKAIIAVSEEVRENLVNHHKVPKKMIFVVPPAPSIENERKAKGYEENQVPVIGTIVSYQEDLTYFLKGAKKILEKKESCEFLIGGRLENRSEMEKRAKEMKILDRITFAETITHPFSILPLIHFYIGLQGPSKFGQDLLDAMMDSKITLALAKGVNFSLIDHEKTGILLDPEKPEEMAEHVLRLLEKPEEAQILQKNAKEEVLKNRNLSIMMESIFLIYQKILEEKS